MAQPTLTVGRLITIYRVHAGDHRLAIGKSIFIAICRSPVPDYSR